mmetsp:Transcript_47559/g.136020  ORF Transcript_47559/g.136020 Transcript_47559/m.136020 type:complete len:215 (+) Transcript_47559:647-1291(+)
MICPFILEIGPIATAAWASPWAGRTSGRPPRGRRGPRRSGGPCLPRVCSRGCPLGCSCQGIFLPMSSRTRSRCSCTWATRRRRSTRCRARASRRAASRRRACGWSSGWPRRSRRSPQRSSPPRCTGTSRAQARAGRLRARWTLCSGPTSRRPWAGCGSRATWRSAASPPGRSSIGHARHLSTRWRRTGSCGESSTACTRSSTTGESLGFRVQRG